MSTLHASLLQTSYIHNSIVYHPNHLPLKSGIFSNNTQSIVSSITSPPSNEQVNLKHQYTAPALPSPPSSPSSLKSSVSSKNPFQKFTAIVNRPRHTVKFASDLTSAIYETWSNDEYPDRSNESSVARLKYQDMVEIMAFKSLMRRQHLLASVCACGTTQRTVEYPDCEPLPLCEKLLVPTLEIMEQLGM